MTPTIIAEMTAEEVRTGFILARLSILIGFVTYIALALFAICFVLMLMALAVWLVRSRSQQDPKLIESARRAAKRLAFIQLGVIYVYIGMYILGQIYSA